MKKTNLLFAALFCTTITDAQIQPLGGGVQPMGAPLTQTWTTTLMTVPSGINANLGTQNDYPLGLFTSGQKRVEVSATGRVKVLGLADGGSTGLRFLYVDTDGNIQARCSTCPLPIACGAGTDPWLLGGNTIPSNGNANIIGTCNQYNFILQSYGKKSVFLKTNGKVGIGENNYAPAAALDISDSSASINQTTGLRDHLRIYGDNNGGIEATGSMNLAFNDEFRITQGGLTGSGFNLLYYSGGAGGGNTQLNSSLSCENINSGYLHANVAGSSSGAMNAIDVFDQYTNKVNFRVKSDGNVWCRDLRVTTNNFPDFVFEKNYKLMSLTERETYIKTQKHLPYMISVNEVETSGGAPVGEVMTGILQNTEDLTLYVIEMQKQIEILKAELQTLKSQNK